MTRFRNWTSASLTAALLVLASGVLTSSAASSGASAFVPITPCRLLDTRPAPDTVGTRTSPVGPGETYPVAVWGANGKCTLPSGITGVSMNVAIISPTGDSFLTVWPSDEDRPLAASLNWVAGQAPTPNAVTAALSADGKVSFYSPTGTVHLAVDIVGYYEPTAGGPAGPTGATGPRGYSAWDALPSGVTVTGEIYYDTTTAGNAFSDYVYAAFPGVAPALPIKVNFAPDTSAQTVDDDATCTGNYHAPTAPAGQVCLYYLSGGGLTDVRGEAALGLPRQGFLVRFSPAATAQDLYFYATWAYRAP